MDKKRKHHPYTTGVESLDKSIQDLITAAGGSPNEDLLKELIVTAIKMVEDGMERGDIKLMTIALKEMRYAFKVFYPFQKIRKVAIFGSARVPREDKDYQLAAEFAREMVKYDWMVITGAASGIMHAGHEGAGREHSFGVNIRLPFEQEANEVIADDAKLINFKYFFTRKLVFMRESDATVLFPGGFGTHDEGFETLTLIQTGKAQPRPVVCIDHPGSHYWKEWREYIVHQLAQHHLIDEEDLKMIYYTHDPVDAAKYVADFYKNYHSSRYVGDQFIIRTKKPLPADRVKFINDNFKDLLSSGEIVQHELPFEEEIHETNVHNLSRLAMNFNRKHFSRLISMIHELNKTEGV